MSGDLDAPLYAALAERLRAHGLGRVSPGLLALARPAIHLDLTRVQDEATLAIGSSKIGGRPDLPATVSWPTASDGAALPFIAQIHLAAITAFEREGELPHDGLLSFFYAMNEADGSGMRAGDDPSAWRVLWTPDDNAPLRRLEPPTMLAGAPDARFPPCAVAFARRLTLPEAEALPVAALGLTDDERRAYSAVSNGADVGYLPVMDHHLLGYPYALEPSPFLAAYEAEHGGAPHESAEQARTREEVLRSLARLQAIGDKWAAPEGGFTSPWARARAVLGIVGEADLRDLQRVLRLAAPQPTPDNVRQARAERSRAVDAEWRLLLQVYSNEEADMDWGGGGVLHFGIKRAALASRDFSQVWVSLQFL